MKYKVSSLHVQLLLGVVKVGVEDEVRFLPPEPDEQVRAPMLIANRLTLPSVAQTLACRT